MRTSFHHQPEAQHPIFQLSTSWQADYPIFRGKSRYQWGEPAPKRRTHARLTSTATEYSGLSYRARLRTAALSTSRCGILMKLTAAHEPPGNVGRLQFGAFRRRMGGEVANDGDEDMPTLGGIAPLAELAHDGVQHLVGMETCVLAQ